MVELRRAVTQPRTIPVKYYVGDKRVRRGQVGARYRPSREVSWDCEGHPTPEIFHPWSEAMLTEAQAMCLTCPARRECLARGMQMRESGVWGGVMLDDGRPTDELYRPPAHRRPKPVEKAG